MINNVKGQILATIRRIDSTPILLKALLVTLLIWGVTWYLPAFLLRGHYQGVAVSPVSPLITGLTFCFIIFANLPVFTVWFWLPREATTFAKRLEELSPDGEGTNIELRKRWHLPISASIVSVAMALYVYSLSNDAITEWYEAVGWWGWSFFIITIGAQAIPAVIILFRILGLIRWFKKRLNRGVIVQPLHPDGCGGLGFIARTFGFLTLFAIMLGFWLVVLAITNLYWNNQGRPWEMVAPGFIVNGGTFTFAYFSLVWGFLYFPTMATHRAMVMERNKLLGHLSTKFNDVLQSGTTTGAEERVLTLQRLWTEYSLVKDIFPVWPFTLLKLRGLGILAFIPPGLGLAGSLLQILART